MAKPLALLAAAGAFALVKYLWKEPWAMKAAAVVFPLLACMGGQSWEALCLIPLLSLGAWLNLPVRLEKAIPQEAEASVGFVPPQELTEGFPKVIALCAPLQIEEAGQRRRGGQILFNTALALCREECPEDAGLGAYAAAQGFDRKRLAARMPLVERIPREQGGVLQVCHQDAGGLRYFIKGEPEAVLSRCTRVMEQRERELTEADLSFLARQALQLRQGGLSLYAYATGTEPEGRMTFLGLAGLAADIRPGAYEQVRRLIKWGVRPVLLADESRESAWALACETGLAQPGDRVLTARELARMDDDRLAEEVRAICVYTGLGPEERERIAAAWAQWGERIIPLEPGGLARWERAILAARALSAGAARARRLEPWLIFLPCVLTLAAGLLGFWPLAALALAASLGGWGGLAWQCGREIKSIGAAKP